MTLKRTVIVALKKVNELPDVTREAPKEFLLIPFGTVETTKGTFQFSPEDAKELLAERERHSADVLIDWEHDSLKSNIIGPKPAAGWCNLQLRQDGVWAVIKNWSPTALKYFSTGEYRYFSPTYEVDTKSGHIKVLINLALTNLPATLDIDELVAAGRLTIITTTENDMASPFASKLKKKMSAKKLDLKAASEEYKLSQKRLKELMDGEEPTQEEMKSCGLLGEEGEDDEQDDETSKKISKNSQDDVVEPPPAKKEDLDLVALTGHSDPKKQAMELARMAANSTKVKELEAEVANIKTERIEAKRKALIELGKTEGKLTPPLIRFWQTRPVEEFEEFLASAPSVGGGQVERPAADSPLAILTREEMAMCEATGEDPKKLAEYKKLEQSGEIRQRIRNSYEEVAE